MVKKIIDWLPPLIWAVFIFIFSSRAVPVTSEFYWNDFIFKKTAHVLEYGFLTLLIFRSLNLTSNLSFKKKILISVAIVVLYAASDEFHQSFVPGREPRIRDVVFDTIGSLLAVYGLWKLLPKAPQKLKKLAKSLHLA